MDDREAIKMRLLRIAWREFEERTTPEAREAVRQLVEALFAAGYAVTTNTWIGSGWCSTWERLACGCARSPCHSLIIGRVDIDTGLRISTDVVTIDWDRGADAVLDESDVRRRLELANKEGDRRWT